MANRIRRASPKVCKLATATDLYGQRNAIISLVQAGYIISQNDKTIYQADDGYCVDYHWMPQPKNIHWPWVYRFADSEDLTERFQTVEAAVDFYLAARE